MSPSGAESFAKSPNSIGLLTSCDHFTPFFPRARRVLPSTHPQGDHQYYSWCTPLSLSLHDCCCSVLSPESWTWNSGCLYRAVYFTGGWDASLCLKILHREQVTGPLNANYPPSVCYQSTCRRQHSGLVSVAPAPPPRSQVVWLSGKSIITFTFGVLHQMSKITSSV